MVDGGDHYCFIHRPIVLHASTTTGCPSSASDEVAKFTSSSTTKQSERAYPPLYGQLVPLIWTANTHYMDSSYPLYGQLRKRGEWRKQRPPRGALARRGGHYSQGKSEAATSSPSRACAGASGSEGGDVRPSSWATADAEVPPDDTGEEGTAPRYC